jgi:hypothetical protein
MNELSADISSGYHTPIIESNESDFVQRGIESELQSSRGVNPNWTSDG